MNVALTSGLSISASLQLAVGHLDAASGTGRLLGALAAPQRPLDEALDEFGRMCGPRARAFAAAVTGSLRTGIPLAPELERLGRELRDDRRRRLEGKVRRLPVLLLFPLVRACCPHRVVAIVPFLVAALARDDGALRGGPAAHAGPPSGSKVPASPWLLLFRLCCVLARASGARCNRGGFCRGFRCFEMPLGPLVAVRRVWKAVRRSAGAVRLSLVLVACCPRSGSLPSCRFS